MTNEFEFKTDENGEIDLNYYMHEAEQMRADYIAELASDFKKWLHNKAHNLSVKLFSQYRQLTH